MRLAILETGRPPAALVPRFGRYATMFERLLAGPGRRFESFDATRGEYPALDGFDGLIVTGSSAGVYDPLPWIPPLLDFLRGARGKAPMVGVCFGHQAMAQAFGGEVIKSPKGRGVGLHRYQVESEAPWMEPVETISIPASHGDQVVTLPPDARVLAGNDFCPYGMLDYGDAASIQLHPEFEPDFAAALIEGRWDAANAARDQAALESLKAPNDCARVGGWIGRFLEGRG